MPARPAAAAPRPSRRAPAARATRERSTATPEAAAPPSPEPYTTLQKTLATIFSQGQKTTAGHRKLVANLRGIFDQCIAGAGSVGSTIGSKGRQGEKVFTRDFCRLLNRVLVVKKSEVVGDRCLRLADLFVKNLVEGGKERKEKKERKERKERKGRQVAKDDDGDMEMEEVKEEGEEEEEEEEEEKEVAFVETSAIRVVLRILNHLIPFLTSKERGVRYRTAQLLALLLSNSLPTFPFDYSSVSLSIFRQVRVALIKRIQDKEAIVRVQAVIGLVRLLEMGVSAPSDAEEDSDDDDDDEQTSQEGIVAFLIEALQNDPSSDVRRTILYNLSPTQASLPYLLERSRDVDAATRRAVFTRLLPTLGDFRHLSIGMREKLLRWGLNDRDDSVRQAAKKMFNYRWVDDAGGDLLEVLERLDVTSEGLDSGPKYLALKGFWEQRKDVLEGFSLPEEFWENLTPEGSFLARSLNDYCRSVPLQEAKGLDVDERMPEVTRLAFYLQKYLNKLVAALHNQDKESVNLEFIVQQLLLIAMTMDYGDEIGRRKMFALLRECLGIAELSEPVTRLIVDGLRKLATGEGDFCMLILEVIAEVHDTIAEDDGDGEDSFHSAQSDPEEDIEDSITVHAKTRPASGDEPNAKKPRLDKRKRDDDDDDVDIDMMDVDQEPNQEELDEDEEAAKLMKELMVNMKCLHIAQCMLENVAGGLKSNTHLVTMLNGLIVPAVRSHEAPVREAGLRCLGLSCLLDRSLAEENLTLFAHCFNKGHDSLQVEALHIISDILLTHGDSLFEGEACSVEQRHLYRMLAKATRMDENEEVQATAVEVICKLMLAQVITDEELLKVLVTSYFDPATAGNQSLRQTLSYFLPVFCHSSPTNALTMAAIAVSEFRNLLILRASLDDGEDQEMVAPALVAAHFVEWTDPRKIVSSAPRRGVVAQTDGAPMTTHAIVARDALERVATTSCPKEERKLLVNAVIGKCHVPKEAGRELLKEVYEAVVAAIEAKVVAEVAGKNVLSKIEVGIGKLLAEIQEEEGGEETMLRVDGDDDDDDEEEVEEDLTVVPEVRVGDGKEEVAAAAAAAAVDEGEESERTPAVTEDEDEDD